MKVNITCTASDFGEAMKVKKATRITSGFDENNKSKQVAIAKASGKACYGYYKEPRIISPNSWHPTVRAFSI